MAAKKSAKAKAGAKAPAKPKTIQVKACVAGPHDGQTDEQGAPLIRQPDEEFTMPLADAIAAFADGRVGPLDGEAIPGTE